MKQKIQLKTPITYYGGKQKMLEYILPLIPEHRYGYCRISLFIPYWEVRGSVQNPARSAHRYARERSCLPTYIPNGWSVHPYFVAMR